jgi:TonB family protein
VTTVVRLRLPPERRAEVDACLRSAAGHAMVLVAIVVAAAHHPTRPAETALGVPVQLASSVPAAQPAKSAAARPKPPPPKAKPPEPEPDPQPAVAPPEPEPEPLEGIAPPREEEEPAPRPKPRPKPVEPDEPAPQGPAGPTAPPDPNAIAASVGGGPAGPGDPYAAALVRRVASVWVKPRSGLPPAGAVVTFELSRAGRASAIELERSSGSATFDRAALRATEVANPYPPIPASRPSPSIRVHFEFVP